MADQFENLIEELRRCRRVLITTHVRPDGDALGTAAAMWMGLAKKGIAAEVLLLSPLPRKYGFIFQENQIPFHVAEGGWPDGLALEAFDALLVVDTGTWSQLPGMEERIVGWDRPKLVLDHHLTQEDWATHKLVDTSAAAAGEIATELLERWGVEMDPAIATALYLAIVSDTGWFHYSNTRPHTLRMAADLVEAGVDTDRLYQLLYYSEKVERIRLHTRALRSLELFLDDRVAVMRLLAEDFERSGGGVGDTENVINQPLAIESVEVSILMVNPPHDPITRISFRSKGSIDVARFAERFGGGGHARAAGCKTTLPIEEAYGELVEAMAEELGVDRDLAG